MSLRELGAVVAGAVGMCLLIAYLAWELYRLYQDFQVGRSLRQAREAADGIFSDAEKQMDKVAEQHKRGRRRQSSAWQDW